MNSGFSGFSGFSADEWYALGLRFATLREKLNHAWGIILSRYSKNDTPFKRMERLRGTFSLYIWGDLDRAVCEAYPMNIHVLPGYEEMEVEGIPGLNLTAVFCRLDPCYVPPDRTITRERFRKFPRNVTAAPTEYIRQILTEVEDFVEDMKLKHIVTAKNNKIFQKHFNVFKSGLWSM